MLRSFLLSIKMIIIIFLYIIFGMSIKVINIFLSKFTCFFIKQTKNSCFTCFRSFFSIQLVNTVFFHHIVNLFKLSTFYKLRNKNKLSIFNLTRSKRICILIKIHIIIEVLLNLNKVIQFFSRKSFSIHYLFNKRKMVSKLTSTCNTSNPFFKCNI